jgi:hypothetical protein
MESSGRGPIVFAVREDAFSARFVVEIEEKDKDY